MIIGSTIGIAFWVVTAGCSAREGGISATVDAAVDADVDVGRGDENARDLPPPPSSDVEVIITADNAYGFGYGSREGLLNYFGGVESTLANQIFSCPIGLGPESYLVPAERAEAGAFLYIVSYADGVTTQGVIGQFRRGDGTPIYTGHGAWEVCATGQDFNPGEYGGPSVEQINEQIVACNAGSHDPETSSGGWVDSIGTSLGKLQAGEDNTTMRPALPSAGNEFPVACGIDDAARWMWFNWDPEHIEWPTTGSPFIWPTRRCREPPIETAFGPPPPIACERNPAHEFLIFRLEAGVLL